MLSRAGVCERASIDEVYLDLTEAAAARLLKNPPKFESLPEEALKTHILGLPQVTAKLLVRLVSIMCGSFMWLYRRIFVSTVDIAMLITVSC